MEVEEIQGSSINEEVRKDKAINDRVEGKKNDGVSRDKENLDPQSGVGQDKSRVQGSEVVFGAGTGQGPKSNRINQKGWKSGNGKSGLVGCPKQVNNNRPTWGLVYGPTTGEVELSESGKRLRVERSNVGRAGKSVVAEGLAEQDGGAGSQDRNGSLVGAPPVHTHESPSTEMADQGISMAIPIVINGA
ncbi:unnamed protein product [Microthlaspi erraticum]|uniref:Uncharacterized protein n=1 Tax=Microthlaspi erraticum TaxID=1685480 RepID=A0A6D2JNE3_9BRAS|nr:unnamed protein product [Microthlaspi erraticum]